MSRLSARFCLRLLTILAFTVTMVTVGFGHQRVMAKGASLPPELTAIYGEAAADFCGDFSDAEGAAGESCPLCRLVDAAMMPAPLCLYRDMEYVALPDRVAETAELPQRAAHTSHTPRAPPAS